MVAIPLSRRPARRSTSRKLKATSTITAALISTLLSLSTPVSARTITIHDGSVVDIDIGHYPPATSAINSLDKVLDLDGSYGFVFNSSDSGLGQYGRYNYCNMPHVRRAEYVKPDEEYQLYYVELVTRNHKGTPEQTSLFSKEPEPWHCDDTGHYLFTQPFPGRAAALTYLSHDEATYSPFADDKFYGTCFFPQVSNGGLSDSWQHGHDIRGVYRDMFSLVPSVYEKGKTVFRVTNQLVTGQTAAAFIRGLYSLQADIPISVQRPSIDSLEPAYPCPAAEKMFANIASTLDNSTWKEHLIKGQSVLDELNIISGADETDKGWHDSFERYVDNLAARTCHSKNLPCKADDPLKCVSPALTDSVFRMGQYEYSYIYRDHPESLAASAASFGVWVAELAQHWREKVDAKQPDVVFRQHFANIGGISRLLSILQTDVMVLPGMGAELSFELWFKRPWDERHIHVPDNEARDPQDFFVRVLWGGRPLRSSNPTLGTLDMIPLQTIMAYFDDLVGVIGEKIPAMCTSDP